MRISCMAATLLLRYFKLAQIIGAHRRDVVNKHRNDSSGKFLLGSVEENLNFDL